MLCGTWRKPRCGGNFIIFLFMETSSSPTSRSSIGIFITFMATISLFFHANDLVKATHNSTSSGTPAVGEGRAKKVVGRNGLAAGKTLQHDDDDELMMRILQDNIIIISQLNGIVKLTLIKRLLRYFSRREWEGGVCQCLIIEKQLLPVCKLACPQFWEFFTAQLIYCR